MANRAAVAALEAAKAGEEVFALLLDLALVVLLFHHFKGFERHGRAQGV